MSKFKNGKIYIIINCEDITQAMVNYSTSISKENMPQKTVGGIVKRIIEISEPANDMFISYTWYGQDEIIEVWDAL